jgi:hypothetical protein
MISMKKILASLAIVFAVMSIAGTGVLVNAQTADPCSANPKPQGCNSGIFKALGLDKLSTGGTNGIQNVIIGAGNFFVIILASASVLYLIFNAYKMVSDNGDGKGYKAGLDGVKYAIIGLVVALLAFGIVSLITSFVLK